MFKNVRDKSFIMAMTLLVKEIDRKKDEEVLFKLNHLY
jgi:hypothetical protein